MRCHGINLVRRVECSTRAKGNVALHGLWRQVKEGLDLAPQADMRAVRNPQVQSNERAWSVTIE